MGKIKSREVYFEYKCLNFEYCIMCLCSLWVVHWFFSRLLINVPLPIAYLCSFGCCLSMFFHVSFWFCSLLLANITCHHKLLPLLEFHTKYLHHPCWCYCLSLLASVTCVVIMLGTFLPLKLGVGDGNSKLHKHG
jgi:hypothetical protein